MHRIRYTALISLATLFAASNANADAIFHIWVEAPSVVQAGSTFTVSVWGEVSGSVLNEGKGAFSSFSFDVFAVGMPVAFLAARVPIFRATDLGAPEPNAHRGVIGINHVFIHPFRTDNPALFAEYDVQLLTDATGSIEIDVGPNHRYPDFMVGWWPDYEIFEPVLDSDPGSTRIITPTTIRVIPASGSTALLTLTVLAASRRRRACAPLQGLPRLR